MPSPAIKARVFPVVWPVTTPFPAILTAGIAMAHAEAPTIIVTRSLEEDIADGCSFELGVYLLLSTVLVSSRCLLPVNDGRVCDTLGGRLWHC
jgi:hypothetical protein